MAAKEAKIIRDIMLSYSKLNHRLWRANAGSGFVGPSVGPFPESKRVMLAPGDVVVRKARRFIGFPKGFADTLGFTVMFIRPEDVGKRMAIFTSYEVKTGKLKATKEQSLFIKMVRAAGGIAAVIRDADDIKTAITEFKQGD